MTIFSSRLPHVLTQADLAHLLSPTYAREVGVDEELARERMTRAMQISYLSDRFYEAVSAALASVQGSRTEDAVIDKLSKAVPKRLGYVEAAPETPALSALTVLINLELGLTPDTLRATLESDKGQALLEQGFRALGEYLVRQLVR